MTKTKGPAATPSLTGKTEEFLKTRLPFKANIGGSEVDVLHIDKYVIVTRDSAGVGIVYKASLASLRLPPDLGDQLEAHLAVF